MKYERIQLLREEKELTQAEMGKASSFLKHGTGTPNG